MNEKYRLISSIVSMILRTIILLIGLGIYFIFGFEPAVMFCLFLSVGYLMNISVHTSKVDGDLK